MSKISKRTNAINLKDLYDEGIYKEYAKTLEELSVVKLKLIESMSVISSLKDKLALLQYRPPSEIMNENIRLKEKIEELMNKPLGVLNKENAIDHIVDSLFRYDPQSGIIYYKIPIKRKIVDSVAGIICRSHGYLKVGIEGKYYMGHRVAWRLHYGKWPEYQIDHINGNRSDNRICNLRDVKPKENQKNRKEHRQGQLLGTYFCKKAKKYKSQICFNKKKIHLGMYFTEKEAHEQYINAQKALKHITFNSPKELRQHLKTVKKIQQIGKK